MENISEFAAAFACAVTTASARKGECVAKNGDESIFHVLRQMVPEVICVPLNIPSNEPNCILFIMEIFERFAAAMEVDRGKRLDFLSHN